MLRSRRVSWMTAGGMVMMAGMTGCDQKPPTPPSFGSVEQCMLAGNPKADCEAAAEKVAAEHQTTAPKYADNRSCEAIHGAGNCEVRRSGSGFGDVFMPAMAGFILGQALSGGAMAPPQPIYRDPRGYAYLPGQAPWLQRPTDQQDQGRGRSIWGGSSGGGGYSGGDYSSSGSTASSSRAAPSSAVQSAAAPSAQRGVLGGTGRASATSSSAGS